MKIPEQRCRELVSSYLAGQTPGEALRESRGDCLVLRIRPAGEPSVVAKLWSRPGWRGALRRLTSTSNQRREYHSLERLQRIGVRAPEPLGCCELGEQDAPWTEALLMEDLGECEQALEYVKKLAHAGRKDEVQAFLDEVVEMTRRMVEAGIVDGDHSLINIVATAAGRPVRIDLELATRSMPASLQTASYGRMLGFLIGTYAYALQPEVGPVEAFARDLVDALKPPHKVLEQAEAFIERMMREQRELHGIVTRVPLPW